MTVGTIGLIGLGFIFSRFGLGSFLNSGFSWELLVLLGFVLEISFFELCGLV